jgi:hypothetical protein
MEATAPDMEHNCDYIEWEVVANQQEMAIKLEVWVGGQQPLPKKLARYGMLHRGSDLYGFFG